MRLHEVLDGAPEGTRIRRRDGWRNTDLTWEVRDNYLTWNNGHVSPTVSNLLATDWERVPTEADIAALRMAMLEAAQAAMFAQYGNRAKELRAWESAKAAYEAAKGAI